MFLQIVSYINLMLLSYIIYVFVDCASPRIKKGSKETNTLLKGQNLYLYFVIEFLSENL